LNLTHPLEGCAAIGAGIKRPAGFSVSEKRLCNADVHGQPLAGVLAMGGREFAVLAGDSAERGAELRDIDGLIAAGTMALPSFAEHDALFPGSAGKGKVVGAAPATPGQRRALALLYVALLTDTCLDAMGDNAATVLDGTFVKDPLYPALVAALRPARRTLFNTDAYGTAAGAALLAGHGARARPVSVDVRSPERIDLPNLADYAARWRLAANGAISLHKEPTS